MVVVLFAGVVGKGRHACARRGYLEGKFADHESYPVGKYANRQLKVDLSPWYPIAWPGYREYLGEGPKRDVRLVLHGVPGSCQSTLAAGLMISRA